MNPLWLILAGTLLLAQNGIAGRSRATSEGTMVQEAVANSAARSRPSVYTGGVPDGIAQINGSLHYIKDGRATLLQGPQRFAEGLSVQRNGDILLEDGRLVRLREGWMVTLAGELRDTPRQVELPRPVYRSRSIPSTASAPRNTD